MPETYTPDALAAAREYFRQPEPRFWTWSDDAISWTDGTTIVFHRELAEIMRRLAMDGLPRFTPLLLLLAACRDSYRRERVREVLAREKALLTGSTSGLGAGGEDLLAALDRVAALPAELRSTVDAKVALIETVVAGRRFFPADDALAAAELLQSMPPTELFGDGVSSESFQPIEDTQIWTKHELIGSGLPVNARPHVTSALLVMCQSLRQLDAAALRLRLRTGLDQLVEPAEIEPPADDSLRAFISRLGDDPELSGLGRLAHNLMAAVQVPRAVSEPEDLRLGGVSDIANRGPLDRLLVSELAHDDLTLAVRVAVGEALYLRREAPPRTPVRERCVLIDCGIRLWGVPRVFATAVALALAATADRHTQVATWRALRDDIEPAQLGTRQGLIAQLEKLEAAPQPADALGRFFEAVDQAENAAEAILITHQDVLADDDFRRAVAELRGRQFYIATVDRHGRFRLLAHCGRGTKLVREAQFDLDRLLAPAARPAAPLLRPDAGSDLPVILSVEPFPLLLPHQINLDRMAYLPEYGAVTVTHDRRLMHWRQPGHGAAQITASVPAGHVRHLSIDNIGLVRLVTGGGPNAPLSLLRANLLSGTHRALTVDAMFEEPLNVVFDQQVLYLIGKRAARVVTDDGQVSPATECRFKHAGGRFFTWGVWYALSFDGQCPQLTRVPVHSSIALGSIAAMFDIQGRDGPWVITQEGRVASTIDGRNLWDGFGNSTIKLVKVSDSGQQLILRGPDSRYHSLFLEPGKWRGIEVCSAGSPTAYLFHPELRKLLHPRSLPRRFHQIGIDGNRRLTIVGRRGRALAFGAGGSDANAVMVNVPAGELRLAQPFVPADGPPNVDYHLRVARWADGGRAWLDSRGLLHLKSCDRILPELTLVLVPNGELAGWSSDGRLWGPTFYTGIESDATRNGVELLREIDRFLSSLR